MSTAPPPTVSRGDLTLQPTFFTSSLFVNPLREDIAHLVRLFAEKYLASDLQQPFTLFKKIWAEQGWSWFHFKVFDARARDKFIAVTLRLFAEYFVENTNPLAMVVALFAMYTFFSTQPSASVPSLHSIKHIQLPINVYRILLSLPSSLTESHLLPLQPYATYVLSTLLDAQVFHLLPDASLRPQNPSNLPREIFVDDEADPATVLAECSPETASEIALSLPKKKGRPAKREKAKRARDAIATLDKWLDKNTYTYQVPPEGAVGPSIGSTMTKTTHTLISHPPTASRAIYNMQKNELLDALELSARHASMSGDMEDAAAVPLVDPTLMATALGPGREVLARANDAVMARLKRIDEMAAEQGLEVGGEGGEMTGLLRVEKAVKEFREGKSRGGILNLLDGAGANAAQNLVVVPDGTDPRASHSGTAGLHQ